MNYCFSGKQSNPADLLPKFPDGASVSATINKALQSTRASKITLNSKRPSEVQSPQTPIQIFKEGCERHYKFVENILKRIAANIGNTPSQTDVKIVSCIPIDVTDLQQRIFNLERQLEEARMEHDDPGKVCRKEFFGATARPGTLTAMHSSVEKMKTCNVCHSESSTMGQPCKYRKPKRSHAKAYTGGTNYELKRNKNEDEQWDQPTVGRSAIRIKSKSRPKPDPLIYYVHANTVPFDTQNSEKVEKSELQHQDSVTNIEDTLQKQLLVDFSSSSEYSVPVCRDGDHSPRPDSLDTNVFSCNGKFHNLDDEIRRLHKDAHADSCSKFYDDSLYDLVPVKEKSRDIRKIAMGRKKKEQFNAHMHYLGPNYRATYKIPEENDYVMNYAFDTPGFQTYHKIRRADIPKHTKSLNTTKKHLRKRRIENKDKLRKNISCFAVKMKNNECQTTSGENSISNTTTLMSEAAENTLHQIKETLQTVLETVKTNSRLKPNVEKTDSKNIPNINSEMMKPNVKYMTTPHGTPGPIPLFYTPVQFMSPAFMPSCKHMPHNYCYPSEPNNEKQKEKMGTKQNDKKCSEEKVTDIWKPVTDNGRIPVFVSTTSERDESSVKKEDVENSADQLYSQNNISTQESREEDRETDTHNQGYWKQSAKSFIDDDRLSMVEETSPTTEETNGTGEDAEYEDEEKDYDYVYEDVSESVSLSAANEDFNDENLNESDENFESHEIYELEDQSQKPKKLDKMFHKMFNFFKNKQNKGDCIEAKESKRTTKKFGFKSAVKNRNRQPSKDSIKHDKKRKTSGDIEIE